MSLRDHLQEIYDAHGRLTPQLVVDVAKPTDHPLHERYYALEDREAAHEYRKVLAAKDIRSVRVVYREADGEQEQRSVRAFHAVRDEEGEGSYVPVERVVESEFLTEMVRRDMEREVRALIRRWEHFDEFWQLLQGEVDAA